MADIPNIKLPQGEQIWVMLRTDRDGASEGQIADSIGDLMRWVLREAKSDETGITDLHQVISTGKNEWRVGSARPVQLISISKDRPTYPTGEILAAREQYPGEGIPTVAGDKPWWVVVRLWWRGSSTEVQWPSLIARVGSLTGFNVADYGVDQADWTLDRAIVPTQKAADPGAATWGKTQTGRVEESAGQALSVAGTALKVVVGVAVVAGLIAIFRRR
jgi:hypothetical protein